MRDKTGWIAWDRRHIGGLRVIGLVSGSAGFVATLAFATAMELDLGPRMSFEAEAWVALGVFGSAGGLAGLAIWMVSRVRPALRAEAASLGALASKTTANAAVSATANIMAGESTSEFDMEGFRAPSRVMTIDQALAKASLAWREGKHAKAEGLVKSAIAELEGAWPSGPSTPKDHGHERRLASALATLASFCVEQGKDIEAEPLFRRFLELGDRVFGPDHPKVAQALISLEGLYKRIGAIDLADSIRARRESLRSQAVVLSEARVMLNRAGALFLQGKYAEANNLAQQALALGEKEQANGDFGIDQYLTLLGRIQCALGDLDSAEGHFLHALALVDKTKERNTAERGTVLWNLGQVYRRQGRYLPAEPLLTGLGDPRGSRRPQLSRDGGMPLRVSPSPRRQARMGQGRPLPQTRHRRLGNRDSVAAKASGGGSEVRRIPRKLRHHSPPQRPRRRGRRAGRSGQGRPFGDLLNWARPTSKSHRAKKGI